MKPLVIILIAAACSLLHPQFASPQPAVKKLERRVRELAQRPDVAESEDSNADEAGYLGVVADDRAAGASGVELLEVMGGSPAAQGGLEQGDVITKVDDQPIRSLDDFAAALADQPAGTKLRFGVERRGEPKQVEATLGHRPPAASRRFPNFGRIGEAAEPPRMSLLGVRVEPLDPQSAAAGKLPVTGGAYVVRVAEGSPAAAAGIPPQAVIVAVDDQKVGDPADLKRIIAATQPGQEIKVAYYSRGKLVERQVRLAELMPEASMVLPDDRADLPDEAAGDLTVEQRMERLERRIRALEARLAEFERFLGRN